MEGGVKRYNEDTILIASAKEASSKAIRTSIAMGLSIKVIRDNNIIEISPDKSERVIRGISNRVNTPNLFKGAVLEKK